MTARIPLIPPSIFKPLTLVKEKDSKKALRLTFLILTGCQEVSAVVEVVPPSSAAIWEMGLRCTHPFQSHFLCMDISHK